MNNTANKQILKNHKLINFLVDYRHFDQVTIDKNWIACICSKKFTPDEVAPLAQKVGAFPVTASKDGQNFLIFKRG